MNRLCFDLASTVAQTWTGSRAVSTSVLKLGFIATAAVFSPLPTTTTYSIGGILFYLVNSSISSRYSLEMCSDEGL
jgi:hypothetical protein